jgi:hypothetical protein
VFNDDKVWKCGSCFHANQSKTAVCYYCGGSERLALYPVRTPNVQQNTPSLEDLNAVLAEEEAARNLPAEKTIAQQLEELRLQLQQLARSSAINTEKGLEND